MELTQSQDTAKQQVIDLFKQGHTRVRLTGSAGTGKTTTARALAEFFVEDRIVCSRNRYNPVYITAPTNKALAVLLNKMGDVRANFKTIHGALRKTLHTDNKTGNRKFIRGEFWGDNESQNFDNAKFCIIDESSMLESEIEGKPPVGEIPGIKGDLEALNFPILYIGDKKQLPPVGESESPVFTKDYPEVELTEIIRQGAGNPIIDLSRDLDLIYFKIPKVVDSNGFPIGYVYNNNIKAIIDKLAEANGTDEYKYLTYTNKVVDAMNLAVRTRLYTKPKRLELEETIVYNSPYGRSRYTNKEEKMVDLDTVTDYIFIPTYKTRITSEGVKGPLDKIRLKYYVANGEVKVLHEQSDKIFQKIHEELKRNCITFGWGWKAYYWFKEQFADIKYNHAITIHKSQGSTYREAVINIADVDKDSDLEEKQKLLYTAVTRPSNLLILNSVR